MKKSKHKVLPVVLTQRCYVFSSNTTASGTDLSDLPADHHVNHYEHLTDYVNVTQQTADHDVYSKPEY